MTPSNPQDVPRSLDLDALQAKAEAATKEEPVYVPCEGCGMSIKASRWFCGHCAKERREKKGMWR